MQRLIRIIILTVIISAIFSLIPSASTALPPGTLIRQEGDTKVYVIENYQRRWIPDEETFNARGYKWDRILKLTPEHMASIPEGDPLPSVKSSRLPTSPYSKPAPQSSQPQQDINRLNAIKQLYRDTLGREADTEGLNNYYTGWQSIDAIRASMTFSSECRQGRGGECKQRVQGTEQYIHRLDAIKQLYRDVLGREADADGLNYYYGGGLSLEAIRQSMLNSSECRQGGGTIYNGECKQRYGQTPVGTPQPAEKSASQKSCDETHKGNCVKWIRYCKGVNLPKPLETIKQKRAIINSREPKAGYVAIIEVSGSEVGHVAYVISSKNSDGTITVEEANYPSPGVRTRKLKPLEMKKVVGYYRP